MSILEFAIDIVLSISSGASEIQKEMLQSLLTEHAERDIGTLREALRKGARAEVRARLKSFRDNLQKWSLLSHLIQGAFLRLEAALDRA